MSKVSTQPGWLVAFTLLAAVAGWLGTIVATNNQWPAPVLGLTAVITMFAVAVLLLVLGIRVARDRNRPVAQRMNPLAAARTLVLAQAATYAGAMIAGWHVGILLHRVPLVGFESATVGDASMMVISGLALIIIGLVVEQWCTIPPDEQDPDTKDTGSRTNPQPG